MGDGGDGDGAQSLGVSTLWESGEAEGKERGECERGLSAYRGVRPFVVRTHVTAPLPAAGGLRDVAEPL